jgi:endo-1,4-beta-D-glucanase Y
MRASSSFVSASLLLAVACSSGGGDHPSTMEPSQGADSGTDDGGGTQNKPDSGGDGGVSAGPDAGGGHDAGADAGTTPDMDAGKQPEVDAGPGSDAGPGMDAGGMDAGQPESDAGHPQPDAGHPQPDAGHPRPDAGHPEPDAGHPERDAGHPEPDAGHHEPDAGHPHQPGGPHPFGTHGGYVAGVRFPSASSDARDQATSDFYEKWKSAYLKTGCKAGDYRVDAQAEDAYAVSEGHGYGMLIAAIMEGYDPDAHKIFDGLYSYYHAHPADAHPNLMAWAQDKNCKNVQGADSATDGDLDIAYALLLADRQWGSAGAIDYRKAALAIIADILDGDIHATANTILVGDWTSEGDHDTGTRTSDFMPSHFKTFVAHGGSARFNAVVDKLYSIVAFLQFNNSRDIGLLPDFVEDATGDTPKPAGNNWLESKNDGKYAWNACRDPWRLSTDYLMSGDARSRDAMRTLNAWVRGKTGNDPSKIPEGYSLTGSALGAADTPMAFIAPFGVASMIEPANGTNGPWVDKVWNLMVQTDSEDYYGDSIRLLSMIVMSENWWVP